MTMLSPDALAIIGGCHADPFRYLGPHDEGGRPVVRAFLPDAEKVTVVDDRQRENELERVHAAGLFSGQVAAGGKSYRLRAIWHGAVVELEDPYRFPPILSEYDLYLLGEGKHYESYDKLGAHPMVLEGVEGDVVPRF